MANRLFTILTLLLTACAFKASAQLTIGFHETARDSLYNMILCSIPEDMYGYDYSAEVKYPGATDLKINGKPVDGEYLFENIRGDHTWKLTGTDSTGKAIDANITFTFLPIVEINGTVEKLVYNTGVVKVLLPEENIISPCKVKFRGGTTNSSRINKRNYHLKFVDEMGEKLDLKIFDGLRKDNSWLLDGGTLDRIRIRNRVNQDLWLAFGTLPYYADTEPKVINGSRGSMVEVFRNGEYQGIYNMCEPVDRKQVKAMKYDEETSEIHGQLWKSDQRTETTKMKKAPMYNNYLVTWDGYEVEYPDIDDINPTDYSTLYNAVKFVAESSDEEFEKHAAEYLDMPVLVDYFIFLQVLMAYDNLGKNNYWTVYDRVANKMISLIPWDLDTTLGQSWKSFEYHPTYLTPDRDIYEQNEINVDWFLKRCVQWNVNGFVTKAQERYKELRKSVLTPEAILKRFDSYLDIMDMSGSILREEKRYAYTTDLGGYTFNLKLERKYIGEWIPKRIEWLDNHYFTQHIDGDANNDKNVDVDDINIVISHILGQPLIIEMYNYRLDADHNSKIDVADINKIINNILKIDD